MPLLTTWGAVMLSRLRLNPRSNGVRVRRDTAIHITTGDMARGRQDWRRAADAYRRALALEPDLQHLWVQLGHMEKEAGAIDRAEFAYQEAARLRPDDAEPLLRLGHMAKAWRQPLEAADYFVAALQRDRGNLQAISELVRLLPDRAELDAKFLAVILDVLELEPADLVTDDTGPLPAGGIAFDVTDLLAFFGQRRLPTGIQRVQIEVALACLDKVFDAQPVFCIYSSARRGWLKMPHDRFEALCRSAKQSDDVHDPAWTSQLDFIYRRIAVSPTIRFSPDSILINLGTSWADRNYLLDIRIIRARDAVIYVPLVFDLIPLIGPEWFMQSLVRDYRAWFASLLHSCDGCVAISDATRRDLIRTSAEWGAALPQASVNIVRLDGDFRQPAADRDTLEAYGLGSRSYVLFVSTLEPRKNHLGAFEAWLALADIVGEDSMPHLVCVGGRGWLNEDVHRMLRKSTRLRRLVTVLHGIPDETLAALYEHCLFTIYPSFYEGWGLPVSESLSYGKVPALSCTSSLPEAGGDYASYYDPSDVDDIAATVRLLLDDRTRQGFEAAIREDYKPRTWHCIANDLIRQASTITPRGKDTLPCISGAGVWTLAVFRSNGSGGGRSDMAGGPISGEALRHGRAWQSPDMFGCRIDGDDAALWFQWSGLASGTLHIHFAATPSFAARIEVDGRSQDIRSNPVIPAVVSWPLPEVAGRFAVAITPTAGTVIVEKIVITCGGPRSDRTSAH